MKKWIEQKIINVQKKEIETFIQMLQGADQSEAALTLAFATHLRNSVPSYTEKLLKPLDLMNEEISIAVEVTKIIKREQKLGNLSAAAGWMVWLHTLRTCNEARLRYLGKLMWRELERGQKHIRESSEYRNYLLSIGLNLEQYDLFPEGLNPNN